MGGLCAIFCIFSKKVIQHSQKLAAADTRTEAMNQLEILYKQSVRESTNIIEALLSVSCQQDSVLQQFSMRSTNPGSSSYRPSNDLARFQYQTKLEADILQALEISVELNNEVEKDITDAEVAETQAL